MTQGDRFAEFRNMLQTCNLFVDNFGGKRLGGCMHTTKFMDYNDIDFSIASQSCYLISNCLKLLSYFHFFYMER